MEIIDLKNRSLLRSRESIKNYFLRDKVVVMPTDTIDGISVRADSFTAVEKIYKIKKRNKNKSLIILVSSINMLKKYCYLSQAQERVLKKIWQSENPTTVLLTHKKKLATNLTNNKYLAVRLPKNDFLRKMIKSLRIPIVSTSLNISGEKNLTINQSLELFRSTLRPDLVVINGINDKLKIKASRLLSLNQEGEFKIIRK
ncbi:MAG: Sua5/YciO/YrdC/YwlC family protein [Clostridia bacterium]|nr:Sua5/YciO/YrdC/YwlC family protein [Clostridia bacterium]